MTELLYIKWLFLWHFILKGNKNKHKIVNPRLTSEASKTINAELIKGSHERIKGFRILRKLSLINRYCLEYGEWDFDEYLADWIYFLSHSNLFKYKTYSILNRVIYKFSKKANLSIDEILEHLWDQTWIFDSGSYAQIKYDLVWKNKPKSEKNIYGLYESLTDRINQAKQSSNNLNEWLINLHGIIPEVMYAKAITQNEKDEDTKSYNRLFEEIKADIIGSLTMFAYSALNNDSDFIYSYEMSNLIHGTSSESDFLKRIKFESVSRVVLPNYWYEEVKVQYLNPEKISLKLLQSLTEFDNIMSIGILGQTWFYGSDMWLDMAITGEYNKKVKSKISLKTID